MGSPHAAHFGAKTLQEKQEIEGKSYINIKSETCLFLVIRQKATAVNNLSTGMFYIPRS